MQELIQQLQEKAGLNAEQAAKAIDVMRDFVKSKVPPFIGDTVDKWFAGMGSPAKEQKAEQNDDFLDG
jgi:deoxyhypusine synthase